MNEPRGLTRTNVEKRLFPGPFDFHAWNLRPAPLAKVIGLGDTPDGPLVFLDCGHSMPYEQTDDLPLKGNEVGCWRCREQESIQ